MSGGVVRYDTVGVALEDGNIVLVANKKQGSKNDYFEVGVLVGKSVYVADNRAKEGIKRLNFESSKVVAVRNVYDHKKNRGHKKNKELLS